MVSLLNIQTLIVIVDDDCKYNSVYCIIDNALHIL